MKYIKLFEEQHKTPDNEYWKVRTDTPYFEISIDKIGMTEDEKKEYLEYRRIGVSSFEKKYIYLGIQYGIGAGSAFYFAEDPNPFKSDKTFKFSGEPEITTEDLEKWNFENTVNKYNL